MLFNKDASSLPPTSQHKTTHLKVQGPPGCLWSIQLTACVSMCTQLYVIGTGSLALVIIPIQPDLSSLEKLQKIWERPDKTRSLI